MVDKTNFSAGREFASTPTLDTERQTPFGYASNWNPSHIEIFGHSINIDIPTGNLLISTGEVTYPYYNFSMGIRRKYDAQEQHMQLAYLRNYPNVNPKPHWFGNWQIGFEADVDEVWLNTYPELHVTSGVGANGLFEIYRPDFKRNFESRAQANRILRTYGIPGRTLAALDWDFGKNDFVLRTKRGAFQILAGRFHEESLVDDIDAQMWLFNPVSGSGFKIISDYFYNIPKSDIRDVGFPLVVSKLIDALGHSIELKPAPGDPPHLAYVLSDDSGREFRLEMGKELTFLDGLNPAGLVRKRLLSKMIDLTKEDHNEYNYTYTDNNLLENVIFPSTIGDRYITYHYDESRYPGILKAIENSFGDQIKFEYEEDPTDNDERLNPRLKIKKITDPEGIEFKYDYDHRNSKVVVTISQNGELDRQIKYKYIRDTSNTKKRYITETEFEVARGYYVDADGRVQPRDHDHTQIIRNRTQYTNDGRYNVKKQIDPLNREVECKYNDFNQVKQEWDFDNHWTKYEYDNPTEYKPPADPSPDSPFRFDLLKIIKQNLIRTVDPGDPTRFITEAIEISTSYDWDRYDEENSADPNDVKQSTHRLFKETDERGKIWTQEYDDAANHNPLGPTLVTSPLTIATRMTYSNRGEHLTIEDAENNTHQYKYNDQGQLIEYIDPNNESIKLRYHECCTWLREFEDQLIKTTQFIRDVEGRIKQVDDPVSDSVNYIYFKNGRLHKIIEHRPAVHEVPGDVSSPLLTVGYSDLESELQYTPLGKMRYLKNSKGLELIFEYDEAGRRFQWYHLVTAPKYTKFLFDPAGQLRRRIDRKNKTTIYEYHDYSGFLRSVQYPSWHNGIANVGGKLVNYRQYDYLGRLFSVDDSELSGTKEFLYDDAGNIVLRRDPNGFELGFEYDDDNRLWHIRDKTGEFELTLTLDILGRPEKVTDSDAIDGSLSWDYIYEKVVGTDRKVLNLYKMIQTDIALLTDFDYDEKNRLNLIRSEWAGAPGPIYSQEFVYRDDDLIEQISGNDANRYRYDGIKQLIFEETKNLTADYDMAGNRKFREDKTATPAPPENEYSELNRLEEDKKIAATFDYDDNGNLIEENGGDRFFYFDGNDRLRRIIKASDYQIDYIYDEEGKLVKRKTDDLVTGDIENTEFSYLINKPIIIKSESILLIVATWDPNGKLLRFRKPNSAFCGIRQKSLFPIYNCFGDVIRLFESDKGLLSELQYDAWGNIERLVDPGGHLEFLGYRGGILDTLSGLIKFNVRWYNPIVGRWISDDPLVEIMTTKQYGEANLSKYSLNNPSFFYDPTGLQSQEIMLDVPFVHQEKTNVCWHAAARMVYGFHKKATIHPLPEFYKENRKPATLGLLRQEGFVTEDQIKGIISTEYIGKLLSKYGPIIASIGAKSGTGHVPEHSIVITGVGPNTIYYNDPRYETQESGKRYMNIEVFNRIISVHPDPFAHAE